MADTFWTWNAHMHVPNVPTKLQTVFRTHTTVLHSTGSQTDCTGTRQRLRAERYPDARNRVDKNRDSHPHYPLLSPARHAIRLDKASSSYPSSEPDDDDAHAPSPSSPTMITWWRRRRDRSASRASKMRPTVWIATTARRDEDRRSIGDRR